MSVWRWLSNTPLTDPVERRLSPLLQLILIGLAITVVIAPVVRVLQAGWEGLPPNGLLTFFTFEVMFLALLMIVRRGHFSIGVWLLVLMLLYNGVNRLVNAPGEDTGEILMLFFLPLTIAGLLGGRRMLLTTTISLAGLVIAVSYNRPPITTAYTVTSFILSIGLIAFLLDLASNTLRQELRTSPERNHALERTHHALEVSSGEVFKLNERLTVTLRSIGDAVIATDVQGAINFINPVAQRLTGWKEADAIGMKLPDVFRIINETTREKVESPVDKVIREGVIVGLANHTLLITRDGKELPIDDSGAPIRDAKGNLVGVILVFRDIEERKYAEKRIELLLELSAAFSQALTREQVAEVVVDQALTALGGTVGTVCLVTKDGAQLEILNRRGLSEETYQEYRFTPLSFKGPLNDAIHQKETVWVQTREEYISRYPHFEEIVKANGSQSTVCVPIFMRGEVVGGISLSFPVPTFRTESDEHFFTLMVRKCGHALERAELYEAEAKARREAEKANQLKIRFLGMVSHELRTPLTSIKGFASSLLAEDVKWDEEEQRSFITILDNEADKLKWLVEQLLDISALQGGTLMIKAENQTLPAILDVAMPQLQMLTPQHKLIMNIPANLPQVMADKNRISQVFVNLVQNAAKFSPTNTTIMVSATALGGEVQVDVCDEGPGIPLEAREYVFEAFRQAENKTTWQKGAGLGLAICKGLIEGHGGRIWIADAVSKGTQISFTLPSANGLTP